MRHITFRLTPGELLKESIEKVVAEKRIAAGCVLSLVGSLNVAVLRMADAGPDMQSIKEWHEPLEIVSGTGTVSNAGCHVHIAIADKNGTVFGGHLKNGCAVNTTVEIVLLVFGDAQYSRKFDQVTGFNELVVE